MKTVIAILAGFSLGRVTINLRCTEDLFRYFTFNDIT